MDKGHTRSAWPPHSYENLYFLQEHYESVVLSRHMVDQIRSIPTLIHKHKFAYELIISSYLVYTLPGTRDSARNEGSGQNDVKMHAKTESIGVEHFTG
jgi:hypothetical protein